MLLVACMNSAQCPCIIVAALEVHTALQKCPTVHHRRLGLRFEPLTHCSNTVLQYCTAVMHCSFWNTKHETAVGAEEKEEVSLVKATFAMKVHLLRFTPDFS